MDMRKFSEVMDIFTILIMVTVLGVYKYVNIYQIVHFKYVQIYIKYTSVKLETIIITLYVYCFFFLLPKDCILQATMDFCLFTPLLYPRA